MMLDFKQIKQVVHTRVLLQQQKDLTAADVHAAREYILHYWRHFIRYHPHDDESLLGLPKPYLVSSYSEGANFDFNEMYYWDTYFMAQGLLEEEHKDLTEGLLEDLLDMFRRFKVIPNASRTYLMGRSQPPFLTSFIFDVYDTYHPGKRWLRSVIGVAKQEYEVVWMGTRKPNDRLVYRGLSRYYDINMLHDLAEAESGWDMNPRFNRRALDYLPIDLNSLLFKYEKDFARAARLLGDEDEAKRWDKAAADRRATVDELMWDRFRGMYYDYNYVKKKRGSVSSLAAYYPLWAGMADTNQAAALVRALRHFEHKGGLSTTDTPQVRQYVRGSMPTQWAYPNGWAPLQLLVIQGLEHYGYHAEAKRIAMKWLKGNLWWYNVHGVFLEKYNVVNPEKPPVKGVYPTQVGFGWTNAVFERLCRDYVDR